MNAFREAANLSAREVEILLLVTAGYTNKAIAAQLNLSVKTIEFHLKNIYKKIKVNSKIEAAVWVVQHMRR